jgi:hypothetical protein
LTVLKRFENLNSLLKNVRIISWQAFPSLTEGKVNFSAEESLAALSWRAIKNLYEF